MCPMCGNENSVASIHGMDKVLQCLKCGQAWRTRIRGDHPVKGLVIDFGDMISEMIVRIGKRSVRLAAVNVEPREREMLERPRSD